MMIDDREMPILEMGWRFFPKENPYYDQILRASTRSKARYQIFKQHGGEYDLDTHLEVDKRISIRRDANSDLVYFRGEEMVRKDCLNILDAEERLEELKILAAELEATLEGKVSNMAGKLIRVPLEAVKLSPKLKGLLSEHNVRIWSGEWSLWWRPNGCGYTSKRSDSGTYSFIDAYNRSFHCDEDKHICYDVQERE